MKILIFTEGTIIMHKNAEGQQRDEIVRQVKSKDESVRDYASYIPIKNSAQKIKQWKKYGAEIIYLTSRKNNNEINDIQSVLKRYDFPKGKVLYRENNENYSDIAEKLLPDILIEDDCESIGGVDEMTITQVNPEIRQKIKSVPVKEFGGIDHLSDNPNDL
jgi:hypothetical protein